MEYCLKAVCHAPQSVKICVVWKTLQYLTFLEKNIKKKKKDKTTTPKPTALIDTPWIPPPSPIPPKGTPWPPHLCPGPPQPHPGMPGSGCGCPCLSMARASLSHCRAGGGGLRGAPSLTHRRRQPLYSLGLQQGHVTPCPPPSAGAQQRLGGPGWESHMGGRGGTSVRGAQGDAGAPQGWERGVGGWGGGGRAR